jgi:glycosyltransferase involved in cell wall biosynthesis
VNNVRVSVIVPVHSRAKAELCAEHVRKQTYPNVELIMVDFKGLPAEKRNYGYGKSHGSLILFLDDDEYLTPNTIASCVEKFNEGFDIVGIPLIRAEPRTYMEKCVWLWETPQTTVPKTTFFKNEVLKSIGTFKEEYTLTDDIDLVARALRAGYKIGNIDVKSGYILHDKNYQLSSVLRKTMLARKPYRVLEGKYIEVERRSWVETTTKRKRIVKALLEQPSLIFGVSIAIFSSFFVRRIF